MSVHGNVLLLTSKLLHHVMSHDILCRNLCQDVAFVTRLSNLIQKMVSHFASSNVHESNAHLVLHFSLLYIPPVAQGIATALRHGQTPSMTSYINTYTEVFCAIDFWDQVKRTDHACRHLLSNTIPVLTLTLNLTCAKCSGQMYGPFFLFDPISVTLPLEVSTRMCTQNNLGVAFLNGDHLISSQWDPLEWVT